MSPLGWTRAGTQGSSAAKPRGRMTSFILLARSAEMPRIRLLRGRSGRLAQGDRELGLAGLGGIIEGIAGAVTFAGIEEESFFDAVRQAGETGLAIDVGADLEIQLAGVHESIGDVDFDLSEVDRFAVGVGDGEIGGAGAETAVDHWDGLGVGCLGRGGDGKQERQEDGLHHPDYKGLITGGTEVYGEAFAGQNRPKIALPVGVTGTGYYRSLKALESDPYNF